ncbi:glycosyltransferase [Alteromonas sp. 5E99-2]|uniref:glycosyltransferase n=1 Tax=Alteromonas sp. 5E99-2 TaxID=2817683 RepID=UPI001A989DD6|nr:glycosyltransferase [Alteromonas sp. 5E99-2]MBO1254418.1 glycosyltransferase [Alteromonas sp. 5E99-2]
MLSIVIPTLDESKTGYLKKILEAYSSLENCEIICVDGGSQDDTLAVIQSFNARLIQTDIRSRAGRQNEGIKAARFDMVLLNHPRSVVDIEGINALIKQRDSVQWGAFTHKFDVSHPLLVFTSWYSNFIRGGLRHIYYLDHCIFAQKQLLEKVGLVPDVDIFEDTDLCLRLRKEGKAKRLAYLSETSAVRFVSNNLYKQAMLNQKLKWQYYLKSSDKSMNKRYEQGLELNTHYEIKREDKSQTSQPK